MGLLHGENSGIFDVFLALSVYLATAWPCCLDSSICALWKAKDCACIGNGVLEKQARKQAEVPLTMASCEAVNLDTVGVYCVLVCGYS